MGTEAYETFKQDRLEGHKPKTKFHDKMTKKKLKTFTDIQKKPASNPNMIVLQADRKLFGFMVLAAESRHLQMADVLSRPLGSLPWSLANGDGTLRRTSKLVLARHLQKQIMPAETIPAPSATDLSLFGYYMKEQAAKELMSSSTFIGRTGTTGGTPPQFHNIAPGHQIQPWRKFLSSSANKANLMRFLVAEFKTPKMRTKLNNKVLYVTSEESCLHMTGDQCVEVAGRQSNQEEADTRVIFHAAHAAQEGYSAVVITSEDTDVLLLCLAFSTDISCPLYQKCGTKNRVRYLDITKLS
ncbi:hypothetical protein GWK47_001897 [Xyrichtys novacula]|uniref:Uncharacterized protein n=1 Tax=Xyrichtys novacula TaxID=13765 RepID=A0AAV1HBA1_XYRNO|nr:hypothetical protein GWK47_001897 [Xyrichtys novacula]